MEVARQRALVKAAIARRKEKEKKGKGKKGASSSAPKAVRNKAPKRKADGKDNHPSKKPSSHLGRSSLRSYHLLSQAMGWAKA